MAHAIRAPPTCPTQPLLLFIHLLGLLHQFICAAAQVSSASLFTCRSRLSSDPAPSLSLSLAQQVQCHAVLLLYVRRTLLCYSKIHLDRCSFISHSRVEHRWRGRPAGDPQWSAVKRLQINKVDNNLLSWQFLHLHFALINILKTWLSVVCICIWFEEYETVYGIVSIWVTKTAN
jgi:hypothetical protein